MAEPLSEAGNKWYEDERAHRTAKQREKRRGPAEPPRDDNICDERQPPDDEPTTWEPVNLGTWLRGEIEPITPSMGIRRTDGLRLIYAGREHAVLGETESGKTWFALGCVAAELVEGHHVVYVHYEEADPGSTIERLHLLGVDNDAIGTCLHFYGPARAPRIEWVAQITQLRPRLVVHDGVNEAMASLLSADTHTVDGAATFRRRLVTPFIRTGAAVLACDHLPRNAGPGHRDAYGTVHKGNVLDGARILLENVEPFGRRMRGVSNVYITKDRPGYLRTHGRASKTPGRTYVGTLVVDAASLTPDYIAFYGPHDDEQPALAATPVADIVYEVLSAAPDRRVASLRALFAEVRQAGHQLRQAKIRDAIDDLIATRRVTEIPGKRGATGYQALL